MTDDGAPGYAVPALDKALDILELLAELDGGLTQSEIALAVGRSTSQIFRVLSTLERRGYLVRDRQSGIYLLSTRMFDLAHRQEPLRGLIQAAVAPMRELAARVSQSCNLSILDGDVVRVIAQVESPADFGYRVRVGAEFPVATTATGALLTGGLDVVTRPDALQAGITDVVVAIRGAGDRLAGALTVPYVATTFSTIEIDTVLGEAKASANAIGRRLGALSR